MNSTTNRPAEGWSKDSEGRPTFTSHEPFSRPPAAPEGYENWWIGRHGTWVQWTYRPVTRRAVITNALPDTVARYLPSNYHVVDDLTEAAENVVIEGTDVAGWTLHEYVLPRLASGLMAGREVQR